MVFKWRKIIKHGCGSSLLTAFLLLKRKLYSKLILLSINNNNCISFPPFLSLQALTTTAKEFCHNEMFAADCPPGTLILMTSAVYGRMRLGRCVKTDFGYLGCYVDVIGHVHERCSGRRVCRVPIPDSILDLTIPCNDDLKSYLDASYSCVKSRTSSSLSISMIRAGHLFH